MNELQKIAALLRHPDKEQRRQAIQDLGASGQKDALIYLAWAVKNESDAELKTLAVEISNRLKLQVEPTSPKPSTGSQSPPISKASLQAKEKRVQAQVPQSRYDFIDSLIGLALAAAFVCSLLFANWLDLSGLQLQSGGTYGDLIEEQKEELWDGNPVYSESIENMNVLFDSLEINNLASSSFSYTPARVIYDDEPLAWTDLQNWGYNIPNEKLEMDMSATYLLLSLPMLSYLTLMLLGGGLLVVNVQFDGILGILRAIVGRIPPLVFYWLSFACVLMNFVFLWLWFALYANKFVAAILDNQDIHVHSYNLLNVTHWQFWLYNLYLIALMGACLYGITRHSPKPDNPE